MKLYLTCGNCHGRYRVENIAPFMTVNNHYYCPGCGHAVIQTQDHEEDYWYHLAGAFGLPDNQEGVNLIKEIYADWDTREFSTFRAFMESLREAS